MKEVTIVTPGPVGVGSVAEALVRIFGIAVRDRVAITRYEPPVAYGIEHLGLFGGPGLIELRPGRTVRRRSSSGRSSWSRPCCRASAGSSSAR